MTFLNAPWAIDGATTAASLARAESYVATGGAEGIVSKGDLKVSPLDVPGNGIKIAAGGALVLNRYMTSPTETYAAVNAGEHIVSSVDMPPSSGSAKSHLVCVTIGDPQFSQVGHPWMTGSDPADGTEATFQYVRVFIITNVPASTTSFKQLGLNYPAYALARLDMPANTTTVTSSEIVDLRKVARPRSKERIEHIAAGGNNNLNGQGGVAGQWENWPATIWYDLEIPEWAVKAKITGFVEGARLKKAGTGGLRVAFENGGTTTNTSINESAPTSGDDRVHYSVGGEIAIPASYRGTTQRIRMEGRPDNDTSKGFLSTDTFTSGQIRVLLEEEAT